MENAFYFFGSLLVFLLGILLTRWVFSINSILNNLRHQSMEATITRRIISRIAMKVDLTEDDIKDIISKAESEGWSSKNGR